jgi:hypothetical protein
MSALFRWLQVFALICAIALSGCSSKRSRPDAAVAEVDAAELDAETPDVSAPDAEAPDGGAPPDSGLVAESGPRGRAFTSAGGRSSSPNFVVYSTTGQPTPVSKGKMKSTNNALNPGILGGK